MTSGRPYRHAMSHEEAVRELKQCAGTQFDPKVVEAFAQLYERQDDSKLVRAREAA
jgi:HD-GYP domain-containing protein (c-di-GMP phosphodiesterase class II)